MMIQIYPASSDNFVVSRLMIIWREMFYERDGKFI